MSPSIPIILILLSAVTATRCETGDGKPPAQPSTSAAAMPVPPCARPTDDRGQPLYQTASGTFVERKTDAGGARFVVITPPESAGPSALQVTQQVYEAVADLPKGRRVTLFGYVSSATSGAQPTYSCIEF